MRPRSCHSSITHTERDADTDSNTDSNGNRLADTNSNQVSITIADAIPNSDQAPVAITDDNEISPAYGDGNECPAGNTYFYSAPLPDQYGQQDSDGCLHRHGKAIAHTNDQCGSLHNIHVNPDDDTDKYGHGSICHTHNGTRTVSYTDAYGCCIGHTHSDGSAVGNTHGNGSSDRNPHSDGGTVGNRYGDGGAVTKLHRDGETGADGQSCAIADVDFHRRAISHGHGGNPVHR